MTAIRILPLAALLLLRGLPAAPTLTERLQELCREDPQLELVALDPGGPPLRQPLYRTPLAMAEAYGCQAVELEGIWVVAPAPADGDPLDRWLDEEVVQQSSDVCAELGKLAPHWRRQTLNTGSEPALQAALAAGDAAFTAWRQQAGDAAPASGLVPLPPTGPAATAACRALAWRNLEVVSELGRSGLTRIEMLSTRAVGGPAVTWCLMRIWRDDTHHWREVGPLPVAATESAADDSAAPCILHPGLDAIARSWEAVGSVATVLADCPYPWPAPVDPEALPGRLLVRLRSRSGTAAAAALAVALARLPPHRGDSTCETWPVDRPLTTAWLRALSLTQRKHSVVGLQEPLHRALMRRFWQALGPSLQADFRAEREVPAADLSAEATALAELVLDISECQRPLEALHELECMRKPPVGSGLLYAGLDTCMGLVVQLTDGDTHAFARQSGDTPGQFAALRNLAGGGARSRMVQPGPSRGDPACPARRNPGSAGIVSLGEVPDE
ncbi:MAG: hypothetical protein IT204_25315 [Fimbriimonadaceae bacterium]|nr:hypothetical protein [Fimbriimonadaceae bacterium]